MKSPGTLAWSSMSAADLGLVVVGVAAVAAAIVGYSAWRRSRITPEERERLRRAMLVSIGKISDAVLVEIREEMLFYAYEVRGVEYTASQDVGPLKPHMPEHLPLHGAVAVRYDPHNPANSIVLAEQWSGLGFRDAQKR